MRLLFYACTLSTLVLLALLLPPTCAPQQNARAHRHTTDQHG